MIYLSSLAPSITSGVNRKNNERENHIKSKKIIGRKKKHN